MLINKKFSCLTVTGMWTSPLASKSITSLRLTVKFRDSDWLRKLLSFFRFAGFCFGTGRTTLLSACDESSGGKVDMTKLAVNASGLPKAKTTGLQKYLNLSKWPTVNMTHVLSSRLKIDGHVQWQCVGKIQYCSQFLQTERYVCRIGDVIVGEFLWPETEVLQHYFVEEMPPKTLTLKSIWCASNVCPCACRCCFSE